MKTSSKVRSFFINGIEYSVKIENLQYIKELSEESNCFHCIVNVKTQGKTYSMRGYNRGCGDETEILWNNDEASYSTNLEASSIYIDLGKHLLGCSRPPYSIASLVDEMVDECVRVSKQKI